MIASLPCSSSGRNGIGGARITLAIDESSSGAASASAMKPSIVSTVAGRKQHAADHGVERVQREPEPGRDAEVAAAAADRPEQVGFVLGVHAVQLAVRRHDLRGQQAVDREAVLADEVAHAAAERDPPDPHRTRVAEPDPQAMSVGRVRELERGQAGLRPRRALPRGRPRSTRRPARSMTIPPSDTPWPITLWPPLRTASSSPVSRASAITRAMSISSATRTIDRRVQVEPAVEDRAGPVVLGVVGSDHLPAHVGPELGDRDAGRCAHDVPPPSVATCLDRRYRTRTHRSRPRPPPYSLATRVGFPFFPTAYACRV